MSVLFIGSYLRSNGLLVSYLLIGAGLYAYATQCGLGLTFDSHYYLSAARSLLNRGTLQNPDGTAYTNWPPLYPLLLAMVQANLQAIGWLNGIFYLATLWLIYLLTAEIQNMILRLLLLGSILFGVSLIMVFTFVWSDGIFVFFVLVL